MRAKPEPAACDADEEMQESTYEGFDDWLEIDDQF
jgi:hypothetical protein